MTDRPEMTEHLTHGLLPEKEGSSPLETFARAAAYTALEPIKGAVQLVTNTSVELVTPPERYEIGSMRWGVQQLGHGCGAAAALLSLQHFNSCLLSTGLRLGTSESMRFMSQRTATWAGAAALSGFEYGFLLPTRPENYTLSDRVLRGAVEAGKWTGIVTGVRALEAGGISLSSRMVRQVHYRL